MIAFTQEGTGLQTAPAYLPQVADANVVYRYRVLPSRRQEAMTLSFCNQLQQIHATGVRDFKNRHPNPIALPHPARQRLPSNGPIKTAPRKISAHPCRIERGSPETLETLHMNFASV
jgi:hypothetical protein